MPTFAQAPNPEYYRLVRKWRKHFLDKGCSTDKCSRLARKRARREFNGTHSNP